MAYLHRLIFVLLLAFSSWVPTSAYAQGTYQPLFSIDTIIGCSIQKHVVFTDVPLTTIAQGLAADANGAGCQGNSYTVGLLDPVGGWITIDCDGHTGCAFAKQACGNGNKIIFGSCVAAGCTSGQTKSNIAQLGWFNKGDMVGVYAAQRAVTSAPGCIAGFGPGGTLACSVTYSSNATPLHVDGVRGHSSYTSYLTGTTTGESCTPTAPPVLGPEPPCEGQSSNVVGTTVCGSSLGGTVATAEQAKNEATKAANGCYARAVAAGKSTDVASQGAAAAGDAAGVVIRGTGTADQASAAGTAACDAVMQSADAGQSKAEGDAAGVAAGAASVCGARSRAILDANGSDAATVAAVSSSARAAASIAATRALSAGGTASQVASAAASACQSATESGIVGKTPAESDAAAAAAGAGSVAGDKAAAGANGDAPASKDPVGDFCAKNPTATMCKTAPESTFGGTCGTPPACSGDAIMCAIAAATFSTNCALLDPKTPTPLYDAAITKTGDQTLDNPKNSAVNVTSSQFDQTETMGAAVGLTDLSVTVMNQAVVLPFSMLNAWLARFGIVFQAVTLILCARIVARG